MSLLGADGEEGYSPFNGSPTSSGNRVGLCVNRGLYFTAIAAFIAILALVNVNWDTEALSKMMIALMVLLGAIGVGVAYVVTFPGDSRSSLTNPYQRRRKRRCANP
jgi:hypothetical protein